MPRQARLNAVLDELGISFRRFGIHSNMETPPGLFGPLSSGDFDQFMQKIDLATVMYEDREWLLLDGNRYGQIIALKERLNTTVN
jgi:hypothetical protein